MKHIFSCLFFCIFLSFSFAQRCSTYEYFQKQVAAPLNAQALQYASDAGDTLTNEIIVIPVIIHILYNTATENISDAQALSQIEALNKDYRRTNNDAANVPPAFAPVAADTKISFCLAKTDPAGRPTTGIIRMFTNEQAWLADDRMKFSASGGDDAWDSKKYLNIWVCNLLGRNLGYSSLPGGSSDKDGIVIQYDVFGNTGTIRPPFDKGRTATHEIGHWLGLQHLWGDAVCGDDGIYDTPAQKSYNNGCPSFPRTSSCSINGNGDMFMNYMDFSDDACMNMFTQGQKNKMRSLFAKGAQRNSFLNSVVCNNPSAVAGPLPSDTVKIAAIRLYPNPSVNNIYVESLNSKEMIGKTLRIYNILGREVLTQILNAAKNKIVVNSLPAGIYILQIGEGTERKTMKFLKL